MGFVSLSFEGYFLAIVSLVFVLMAFNVIDFDWIIGFLPCDL